MHTRIKEIVLGKYYNSSIYCSSTLLLRQVAVRSCSVKRACSLVLPMKEIMNPTLLFWYATVRGFVSS